MPSVASSDPAVRARPSPVPQRNRWLVAGGLGLLLLALTLLVFFFPWDSLRGPINRYVTEKTGRHFAITRQLDVHWGNPTRVTLDGVEMANPPWARDRYLLLAQRVEFTLRLWPLLSGRIVLPQVSLQQPVLGLQQMPDGRRSWALDLQQSGQHGWPTVGALVVDSGVVNYFSPGQQIDLHSELALVPEAAAQLPLTLSFKAQGQWHGAPLQVAGRSGGVLQFNADPSGPFPLELDARSGATRLQASGQVLQLSSLEGMAGRFELQGKSLSDIDRLLGTSWPDSPPYRLSGQLDKQGAVWNFSQLQAAFGRSTLQGALRLDRSKPLALLTGRLTLER